MLSITCCRCLDSLRNVQIASIILARERLNTIRRAQARHDTSVSSGCKAVSLTVMSTVALPPTAEMVVVPGQRQHTAANNGRDRRVRAREA